MSMLKRTPISVGRYGGTVHIPKKVIDYYNIKDKDLFEWCTTDEDIPEVETNLIGIRIRRM